MAIRINAYAGRVFFSDEATALYLWAKKEPNRIKASRMIEAARRLEYAWRKARNDEHILPTLPLPENMIARSEMLPPAPQKTNGRTKLRLV